jgi:tetratricopeptide (TPR) repeat protein
VSSAIGARALIVVVGTVVVSLCSGAEARVTPIIDSAGVHLMHQRYDLAKELLRNLRARDPSNIHALYASFTVRHTEILDYESYAVYGERFLRFIDSAIAVIEADMASGSNADTVRYLFYLGNLHGSKGIILAKTGKWLRAAKTAAGSVGMLREAKERDPTFRAALLGVGLFNYYLSQNLGWVPFVKDRTKEGLRDIAAATRADFPYNYAAMNAYCWILIDRGEYARADSIAGEVLSAYPGNTIFLRIKARCSLMRKDHREALADGKRLKKLTLERESALLNWSDLLMAHEVMATAYLALDRGEDAIRVAREGLALEVPAWARKISHVQDHTAFLEKVVQEHGKGGGDAGSE